MDKPDKLSLITSQHHLYSLGALDDNGKLTTLGRKMIQFPLEPQLSKMLIISEQFGCAEEIVTIVSALSVGNFFVKSKEKQEQAERSHHRFYHQQGDHLTLLTIYNICN